MGWNPNSYWPNNNDFVPRMNRTQDRWVYTMPQLFLNAFLPLKPPFKKSGFNSLP